MKHRKIIVTIEHDSPTVPFNSFVAVVTRTVKLLRGIDSKLTEEPQASAKWNISAVSMNSPLHLTLTPMPVRKDLGVRDSIGPFLEDINRLERGKLPCYMTPDMQQIAKELVSYIGKGIRAIRFSSNGDEAHPTQRVAEYVTELEQPHFEIGSIEGFLDLINVHGHESVKVWDTRFNAAVTCHVSRMLVECAKELLGKRVAVRGRIRYERRHAKEIVDVFDIRMLDDPRGLPQMEDIAPVDLTGGKEPADYLRGDYGKA